MSKVLDALRKLDISEDILDSFDSNFVNRSCMSVQGLDNRFVFTNGITQTSESKDLQRLNSSNHKAIEGKAVDENFLNGWKNYSASIFIKSLAFCSVYCGGNWDAVVRAENLKIYILTANGFKYPNFTSPMIFEICEALFEDQPPPKITSIGVSSLPNGTFMVMDSIFSVYK